VQEVFNYPQQCLAFSVLFDIKKDKFLKNSNNPLQFTGADEYVEGVVCQENEIGENEMKNFDLGDSKVLIVKQNGKISALGTKCSHYGAPLATGALGDGRIRCPW
jgi:hypothetical protein